MNCYDEPHDLGWDERYCQPDTCPDCEGDVEVTEAIRGDQWTGGYVAYCADGCGWRRLLEATS